MWTGLLIIAGVLIAVALGQWWVTRPTTSKPVDVSGRGDEARFDNQVMRGQGLPPY